MQIGAGQLAIRPADMTFEQAMRHYMDEIACTARDTNSQLQTLDNRQGCYHVPEINLCNLIVALCVIAAIFGTPYPPCCPSCKCIIMVTVIIVTIIVTIILLLIITHFGS